MCDGSQPAGELSAALRYTNRPKVLCPVAYHTEEWGTFSADALLKAPLSMYYLCHLH